MRIEPENGLLIGRSPSVLRILNLIDRVKDLDAPVLITGESGTGKELVARAIHFQGARRMSPFVAVNGGAIPDHLLESELFGHARGSFTGAMRDKPGLIEEAAGGTFFLDEVGDLGPPLQAKLLRVLQDKEIRRVGENRTRLIDVRFISATHKDLEREIERGGFREDLYYRLRIVTIEIPPLRDRREDLEPLVDHFTERYGRELRGGRFLFSPRALELLHAYPWPGNIRELQNEIQRCLILCGEERIIRPEHLSPRLLARDGDGLSPPAGAATTDNFFEAKAEFVKRFLRQALLRCGFNKARTAEEIGLSRQALFKLMKKHKIQGQAGPEDGDRV
ncbi:MAG: sigma-54-dependent Fis family transcriptional regulator [Candidatus Aminicenantes bacterium]|nr:sigma-54-dependent Fis family transcriptional regulator [Candidatus Aminicenantes bacterium]